MSSPSATQQYYADPILANAAGHALLTDILVGYVQSQVCHAWAAITGSGSALPVYYAIGGGAEQIKQPTDARKLFGGAGPREGIGGIEEEEQAVRRPAPAALAAHFQVPTSRLGERPDDLRARLQEEIAPSCTSANDLVNPLPPSLFTGSGWHAHHPSGPAARGAVDSSSHYWHATFPTSRLRVPIQISAGDVGVYYIKESYEVLGSEIGSTVACWVDDNFGGQVKLSNLGHEGDSEPTCVLHLFFVYCKDLTQNGCSLTMIDQYVAHGSHYVECELLGEEGSTVPPFKIIGIFTT